MTTALAVMRTSPLHLGHIRMITEMCATCDHVVVLQGTPFSNDADRSLSNPWTTAERADMIHNVFGDRVLLGTVTDLGGMSAKAWGDHVIAACQAQTGLTPTHYFSGADDDALWLSAHFRLDGKDVPEAFMNNLHGLPVGKLVIVNRLERPITGTAVRTMLLLGDKRWRDMTPQVNHNLIIAGFEKFAKKWDAK